VDVTGLQEFLVEWFTDRADRGSLSRLEDAPAPEFEMVTPAGERLDREAPTDGTAEARGRHAGEPVDVDVREVEDGGAAGGSRRRPVRGVATAGRDETGRVILPAVAT